MTDNEVYKAYRAKLVHKERQVHKVPRGLWEDRLAHKEFKAMSDHLVHKDLWDHKVHRETLARPGTLAHPAPLDIRDILERLV